MQIAVTIAFEGIPESDAVQKAVWKHAEALERFCDRITACRVVVARPQHRGQQGNLYSVRIDLTVPGEELVINREHRMDHAHEDVYVALHDAFHACRRRLEDHVRLTRGQVKSHVGPSQGRIARVFPDEGFGFIETPEGREVYFHRNSVVEGDFVSLREGDPVWFAEEPGDKGPQASSVHASLPR